MSYQDLAVQAPEYTSDIVLSEASNKCGNAFGKVAMNPEEVQNNLVAAAQPVNVPAQPSGINTGKENLNDRADFNAGNQVMMRQEGVSILGDCLGQMDKFAVNFAQKVPEITPANKVEAPNVNQVMDNHMARNGVEAKSILDTSLDPSQTVALRQAELTMSMPGQSLTMKMG